MDSPKMTRVFAKQGNEAFKTWFKNSKVVDDSGNPLVVYHSSPSKLQAFRQYRDLGHHFGSKKAAADRMSFWSKDPAKSKNSHMHEVFLSIQNPIELPDLGVWEPSELVDDLKKRGVIDEKEWTSVMIKGNKEAKMEELRKLLKKKGHDGAYYKNTVEDPGSISWIAFEGTQVKSVDNAGTWDKRRASIYE